MQVCKVTFRLDNAEVLHYRVPAARWENKLQVDTNMMFTTIGDTEVLIDLKKVAVIEVEFYNDDDARIPYGLNPDTIFSRRRPHGS